MYLVWGLFLMSVFNYKWMQIFIFVMFSFRLIYSKRVIKWWIVSVIFFYISFNGLPLISSNYIVETVSPYRVSLRQGLNTVDIIGEHDLKLGSKVRVKGKLVREDVNLYQKMRHYKGYTTFDNVTLVKDKTLRSVFWNRISKYDNVFNYFSHDSNTLFSYLSLQLSGFILLVELVYSYFIGDKGISLLRVSLIVFYGIFFGWVFAVLRILLRELVDRHHQILILLLLYPSCALYPGFYLVYGPYLMKHIHYKFHNINEYMVRMFMLWHLFGRLNIIEVCFYPLTRVLAGVISCLVFLRLSFISEFILGLLNSIEMSRFLIVGAPPLLFIFSFLILDRKQLIISMSLLALLLCYFPIMRVSMLNVYQGDAFLIQYPFNAYTILIDTGKESAYSSLKRNLHKKGVKAIDVVVITHDDHDHIGSLSNLVRDFDVGEVVVDSDVDVMGMVNIETKDYGNENDNSLIYYMKLLGISFMFMGDAGVEVENDIVRKYPHMRVDVLKLGHHGSKTSTSNVFLKSIRPQLALISSDPKSYGHPSIEVMALLEKHRVVSVQTSIEGTTSIYLLPFFDIVVSEHGGFGIMKKRMMR